MPTLRGAHALELEALVARCARLGRLDPYELLETYVELQPSGHGRLAEPRVVDVEALTNALGSLPAELVSAPRILVVPRLSAFGHRPVPSASGAAGVLQDGTLLLEARFGSLSLVGLAGALCAIAHELDKARTLSPPGEEDLFGPDEPLVQIGGARGTAAVEPDDGPELTGEAADDDVSPQPPAPASLASLAFTLGLDEQRLRAADDALGGRLLTVLAPSWELPPVAVHTELDTAACRRRVEARAERVAASLAEMGLATRPLHVWVGSGAVTSCLSPYTRELRDTLLAWGAAHPDQIGPDVDLGLAASEDTLYALATDFFASDPRLAVERDDADRTVGILRLEADGLPFELVDLGRVDARVCDARLGAFAAPADAPVLVRLSSDLEDGSGAGLSSLLRLLREHVASVTVLLEGTALEHPPGTILLPAAAMRWAGESITTIPGSRAPNAGDFGGLATGVVPGGVVLSAAHTSLLSTSHLAELARGYALRAVDVGGAATLGAIAEVVATGVLTPGCALQWALVATELVGGGRPSVASTGGLAAYAIAALREIIGGGASRPASPRDRPRPSSGRTVRIKA
jgi:hypothetical protein